MDLQYHDIRPDKGLYYTLERSNRIERVVLEQEIARAEFTPPAGHTGLFPRAVRQEIPECRLRGELDVGIV